MEKEINRWYKKLWETKGARFRAADRLGLHEYWSTITVSLITVYIISINLLVIIPEVERTPLLSDTNITYFTICASILMLAVSLIISSQNYRLRIDKYHECGRRIEEIYDRICLWKNSAINPTKYELEKVSVDYLNIIDKYENHKPIDYRFFKSDNLGEYRIKCKIWYKIRVKANYYFRTVIVYIIALIIPFLILLFLKSTSVNTVGEKDALQKNTGFAWNLEKEKTQNENRNDSTKWSYKNWKADTQDVSVDGKPMINGVFPVPKYELVDSTFNGLGNSGNWKGFELQDKKIIYHSLYVKKNAVNQKFIKDKSDEVFFTIAVLTDSVDLKRYSHTNLSVSSRNHPHYMGQGFVKTKSNNIDFISFITADRNSYAIVNMRLFDLRIGRIVLIAPQKDGTLRSLQLDSPILSSHEMKEYMEGMMISDLKVIDFFTRKNNI